MKLPFMAAVVCIFGFFSTGAIAENWVEYFKMNNVTIYYDASSVRYTNGNAMVTAVADFSSPMEALKDLIGGAYLSYKAKYEFDCSQSLGKQEPTSYFSGHMGRGKKMMFPNPRTSAIGLDLDNPNTYDGPSKLAQIVCP
jgi:hypothetical protein